MKHRDYHYITGKTVETFDYQTIPFESEDLLDSDLLILAFPMKYIGEAGTLLKQFGCNENTDYFYQQCREVISVAEKHQNEKGQGKLSFQAYFHDFPNSVKDINDSAIVVVALHLKPAQANTPREYWLVGYIHANIYEFRDIRGEKQEGFYYNMLRISDRSENGVKVYRRKKIFTCIFSVLHSLVDVYGVHFAYASMGKENQAIVDALVANSKKYNKHFERFPIRNNTVINRLIRKKNAYEKLVDITTDEARLKEMFALMQEQKRDYVFQMYHAEESFLKMVANLRKFSASSKVMMLPGADGKIEAACVAMNWGDYFMLTLENPKGLYKMVASLKITDNILYPFCICGSVSGVDTLLRGVAYYFSKNHKTHVSVLNSYAGDVFADSKKSIIFDDYMFFLITDRLNEFQQLKERSKDAAGNVRYFIDNPIL
ncbi:MAG: hypothetical protein U0T84_09025 [Chitinophagales bacterium]